MQYFGQVFRDGYRMPMYANENGWYAIAHLVFWAIMLGGMLFVAYRLLNNWNAKSPHGHQDPIEIAKQRFARGEITKEELAEIKKELK